MAQKKEGLNGMSENEKLEQAADQAADKPAKTDKKKDVKADKKKPGVFARIGKWFKDMRSELKKVQWPTRKADRQQHRHRDHLLHYRWHLYLAVRCPRRRRDYRPAGSLW